MKRPQTGALYLKMLFGERQGGIVILHFSAESVVKTFALGAVGLGEIFEPSFKKRMHQDPQTEQRPILSPRIVQFRLLYRVNWGVKLLHVLFFWKCQDE